MKVNEKKNERWFAKQLQIELARHIDESLPESIDVGDPLHGAIVAYRASQPDGIIPPAEAKLADDMLWLSRSDDFQKQKQSQAVAGELYRLLTEKYEGEPADHEGESLGRLLAMMDSGQARIITIADNPDLTVDEKLTAIAAIDQRYYGKQSPALAELLDVSPQAIRDSVWWKVTRKQNLKADEIDRR